MIEVVFDGLVTPMGLNLEREEAVLAAATPGQKALYAIWVVDLEVDNGGFAQLFFNRGSDMEGAIAAAERIRASSDEAILREADEVFADLEPPTGERNYSAWLPKGQVGRELDLLDERWVANESELDRRLVSYIETHPSEFFR